ncbi:hypothetical protein KKG55_06945 [Candidatus Micrarchaeota archaeon]|nr:hypothetical protein [Candidatus Micrarchaeota archaeon]MBU1887454.1 hypothetical protein [Candidatus Micrarchaeota archaeon]
MKNRLTELHELPMPRDSKQLQGHSHCYRLRVGPFRIQYYFLEKEKIILIYKISKLDEAYKR